MKLFRTACLGLLTTVGIASTSQAHHSFAMYDRTEIYVITGVVTSMNPDANHLQLFFARLNASSKGVIRDSEGEPEVWSAEMQGAAASARIGINKSGFTPGTIFSIAVHPARNGKKSGVQAEIRDFEAVIFKCPAKTPPAPGMHCDSVTGSTSHGRGHALPEATSQIL